MSSASASSNTRVLFVDDEPSIRLTLPAVLTQNGFAVTTAATVADALRAISNERFEALISDLNVGEPGDGFTVVSAMRRTQPRCINFILTGYPAFESALQAIRSQVDDYLVKPADIVGMVDMLKKKLSSPREVRRIQTHSLADFLHDHAEEVIERVLSAMKTHPRIGRIPLSDSERVDHVPGVLAEIVSQLLSQPEDDAERFIQAGFIHGQVRRKQGYSQEMLVDDIRVLDSSTYAAVQDHLLEITLSNLIPDLSRLNDGLEAHLQASLRAFNLEKAG